MSKSDWQLPSIRQRVRRVLCDHKNICYGPMRDICYNCLAILDEHPNGRGRLTSQSSGATDEEGEE